jgi:membrane-associated protease RseP (regulator of RpoE activity)
VWEPPAAAPPSLWREYGRHALLFVLTALSMYVSGGPLMTMALLCILTAHEMGHYVACRYYGVDATLPFFIPAPFLSLFGTLGAFIRIRAPIPHRRALFDIGIAGPLAGFVVSLPVLVLGIGEAQITPIDPAYKGPWFGEPLLFTWGVELLRGAIPDGYTLTIGPLGMAAWFGLFLTGLNLIPIGQLDGGHVSYSLLRRRAALVSRIGFAACLALIYFGPNWLIWSVLLVVLGRRHPRTLNDDVPIGDGRVVVGIIGLLVFIVCFIPNPIVGSWSTLYEAFRELRSSAGR